jgi:hypothetical protein
LIGEPLSLDFIQRAFDSFDEIDRRPKWILLTSGMVRAMAKALGREGRRTPRSASNRKRRRAVKNIFPTAHLLRISGGESLLRSK